MTCVIADGKNGLPPVQTLSYDAGGNVVSVNYNGTAYYYLRNGSKRRHKVD